MQRRLSIVAGTALLSMGLAYWLLESRNGDATQLVTRQASASERPRFAPEEGPLAEDRRTVKRELAKVFDEYDLDQRLQQRFLLAVYDLQEQHENVIKAVVASDSAKGWKPYQDDLFKEFEQRLDEALGPDHPAKHELLGLGVRLSIVRGVVR